MHLTFDTDVIVASLRSRTGASNTLLHALREGQLEAVASIPMLFEYEAVLMRPEQRQATGMSVEEVGFFLDGLAALLLPVVPYFLWRPLLRDPDDEMVLDAAVNGRADTICAVSIRGQERSREHGTRAKSRDFFDWHRTGNGAHSGYQCVLDGTGAG
jgi:putative PIN family toxin of toxin-antitoxin system